MDASVENGHGPPPRPSILRRPRAYLGEELEGNDWKFILVALGIAFTAGMTMAQFADFTINVFAQPLQILWLTSPMESSAPMVVVAAAFGAFIFSVIVTGQLAVQSGWKQKRGWLIISTILQIIGTLAAGVLRVVRPEYHDGSLMLPEVTLVAAVSGIQIATMRCLDGRVNKVNTIQFFGALVNMVIDPHLWRLKNPNRNVRGLFILSIIAGAWIGSWTYHVGSPAGGSGLTFLVIAMFKATFILGGLVFIPGRKPGMHRSGSPEGSPLPQSGPQGHDSNPCARCLQPTPLDAGSEGHDYTTRPPLLGGESYEMVPLQTPEFTHGRAVSHLLEIKGGAGTWPRSRRQHAGTRSGKVREREGSD